jgi:hypothetical protein
MNKKLASTILFFCLMIGFPNVLFSQSYFDDDKLLHGFDTVGIIIEYLPKILIDNGFTERQLKNDVEIKLRQAKLKVSDKVVPYVYVKVNALESNGFVAFSISLSLNQSLLLERDKSVSKIAPTWGKSVTGATGKNYISSVREYIKDITDEFILDYLKANEPSTTSQNDKFDPDAVAKLVWSMPTETKDSPFTATYIGGNGPPEVEIFNDSDRTIYIDLGQGKLTAYTILSKQSISLKLVNGNYNYKASAARVSPLQGINEFRTGYRYTWRFTILKR